MKAKNNNDCITSKHAALFKNYLRIISDYGELATDISKNKLYEEASKPFFITTPVAGRIIRKMLKNPPSELLMDEEFLELLKSGLV